MIQVIPAIDLLDGKVVRLHQGNYAEVFHYSVDPLELALQLRDQGFKRLHLIDLGGARAGKPMIAREVDAIAALDIGVQVGGGIRSSQTATTYRSAGADRLIVSTAALKSPSFLPELQQAVGAEHIALSVDVRGDQIVVNGWEETLPASWQNLAELVELSTFHHLIVTDITRDGTLGGVNPELYKRIRAEYGQHNLIAAGGVSSMQDVEALEAIQVSECVVGRAFFENNTFLKAVIEWNQRHVALN